jgi:hypothetical protein
VQFLWELLPGARETRNQIIVGYAWIAAIALWIGVPDARSQSHAAELIGAVGTIGVAIALGFVAFLVGSLSDDAMEWALGIRGARSLSRYSRIPALLVVREMPETVRAELERLEASIDRLNAEVTLRAGLVLPVLAATVAGGRDSVGWAAMGAAAIIALLVQLRRRISELRVDMSASASIRADLEDELQAEYQQKTAERERELPQGVHDWPAQVARLNREIGAARAERLSTERKLAALEKEFEGGGREPSPEDTLRMAETRRLLELYDQQGATLEEALAAAHDALAAESQAARLARDRERDVEQRDRELEMDGALVRLWRKVRS